MSERNPGGTSRRPGWDLVVGVVVVLVIAIAIISPRWRSGLAGPIGRGGKDRGITADLDPSGIPKLPPPPGRKHRSPFNDEVTLRAERLCTGMVETQVGIALRDSITVEVTDRYAAGEEEVGSGEHLYFDGVARTHAGRVSAWRCAMKNYGAYPGTPIITHVESPE